jgi:D-alanyl-D-alanine dipeptidase
MRPPLRPSKINPNPEQPRCRVHLPIINDIDDTDTHAWGAYMGVEYDYLRPQRAGDEMFWAVGPCYRPKIWTKIGILGFLVSGLAASLVWLYGSLFVIY